MSRSTPSVYRAPTRLVPRHERRQWIILSQTVEEPHSAIIAPAPKHEVAPAPRATPPSAAASSGAAPKRLHQIEPKKYSAVEARIFLPMAVGCSISCHSDKAWEVNYKPQSQVRRLAVGTITWSTAGCHATWHWRMLKSRVWQELG